MRFDNDGTAAVVDIPAPVPGPREVVVKVLSTGACGSDLAALRGTHPFRFPPLISGHEAGGIIEKVGAEVKDLRPGVRVAIEPQKPCQDCELCTAGNYHVCPQKQMLGITEWDGSFAEYVKVPDYAIVPVSDDIPDYALAVVEPLAVAAHAVRQVSRVQNGDRLSRHLVLGGGTIGGLITAVLQHQHSGEVVVVEPREYVAEILRKLGATDVRSPEDPWGEDERFDAVFIAAGVPELIATGIARVRSGGTVVQVAVFNKDVPVPVGELQVREITFTGTAMYTREDFITASEMLTLNPAIAESIITTRVTLEEGARLITRMAAEGPGKIIKLIMEP
ncbi:zinc-dependent alcohol dehydrogenase [Nesterenkonia muleiensis]|uniref:zinc-dependent alcohol dehydrogenase n=1 Tax=Nesterenkonia muleiensis TaxID=2282648 RepID=UPI00138FE570|nr:alcohol dehydrogenase catalytic domain-containing protein [Nesterenkonia muleiensis]